MNGNGAPVVALAIPRPGYRLWLVFVEIVLRDISIVSQLISQLELCPGIPHGRLLVLTRSARLDFRNLPSAPELPRYRWLNGARAAVITSERIAAGRHRGPIRD
jgi:hypothetical protein